MRTFEPGLYVVTEKYTGSWLRVGQLLLVLETVAGPGMTRRLHRFNLVRILFDQGNDVWVEAEAGFLPKELERIA